MDERTKIISMNDAPTVDELAFLAKRVTQLLNTTRVLRIEPLGYSRRAQVELDRWMFSDMAKNIGADVDYSKEAPLPGYLKDRFFYEGVEFYRQRKDYHREESNERQEAETVSVEPQ